MTKMDRDFAEYHAENLLYCSTRGDRIRSLYRDVLTRMPEDFKPPDVIILADASTAFPLVLPHRCVPNKKFPDMCDGLRGEKMPWFVVLEGSLWNSRKDRVTGIIAHELAHYHLGHNCGKRLSVSGRVLVDNEKAADKQAKKWGFVKEIRAVREYERKRERPRLARSE